tara:strand:+ start:1048 stop:2295 length:1248 start_codon:yes stop_codon:yes gene_type:complete
MCSIYGAFTQEKDGIDPIVFEAVRQAAKDRGRDGGRKEYFELEGDAYAVMGNWRATPTTEIGKAPLQPYGRIVHNGTIANDKELGAKEGEVDSMVLDRILNSDNIVSFRKSLYPIKGSYAVGMIGTDRVFLATNYKPIYVLRRGAAVYFSSMERHLLPVCELGIRPQRVKPYSVLDLKSGLSVKIPRETQNNKRALVIASAGLDSTTAAYILKSEGYEVSLLHFTYGCHAEAKETALVRKIGQDLNADVKILPIDYSHFAGSSTLLNNDEDNIAEGVSGAEFAHEWVPARNLLMIANAVAYAEANGFTFVALGNNLEEGGAYPDNEEEFTNLLDMALDYAVHDGGCVRLLAPVGKLMKHEIVNKGLRLGIPYELTWSCYKSGEKHCGNCGPCFMRQTAFKRNYAHDPTLYEVFNQ